jgi:hypothetical protein
VYVGNSRCGADAVRALWIWGRASRPVGLDVGCVLTFTYGGNHAIALPGASHPTNSPYCPLPLCIIPLAAAKYPKTSAACILGTSARVPPCLDSARHRHPRPRPKPRPECLQPAAAKVCIVAAHPQHTPNSPASMPSYQTRQLGPASRSPFLRARGRLPMCRRRGSIAQRGARVDKRPPR